MVDGSEATGLCVAAFVDDECRGVATASSEGIYLLTIAGNAEETGKTVRFATVYGGETMWFDEELPWRGDWIYGDLDEPQLLHLKVSGINDVAAHSGIMVSPTVVTDVVHVEAGDLLTSVSLYSASGKLLQRLAPGDNHATLNMSYLFSGVYLVEATTQSGARTTKRIVKK